MHSHLNIELLYKILYAIDSDEIQELAMLVDDNLPKEKILKLEKMLNTLLLENDLTYQNSSNIKHFINYFD
jgi:ribosomal protein S13